MNSKFMFILHVPPPIHGSSIVGATIKSSKKINENDIIYISNTGSKRINDINSFTLQKLLNPLKNYFKLLFHLKTGNVQNVYLAPSINGISFLRDFIYVAIGKIFKAKIILHLHNKGVINNSKHLHYHILYKVFFKNAYCLILSEKLKYDLRDYVQKKRIFVCHNGLSDQKQKKYISTPKEVKILWVSNLIRSKGIITLLSAIELLVEAKINRTFYFTIVGADGDIKAKELLDIISKKNLQSYVKVVGKKIGEEKYKLFGEASIFVFPTHYPLECLPIVLIEAMMFNCALISTAEGGIKDLLYDNENGLICERNNPKDLSLKLESLIKNPQKTKKFGQRSREFYEQKFLAEKFENRFCEILNIIKRDAKN